MADDEFAPISFYDITGYSVPLRLEYRLPPNSPLCDRDAKRLAHQDLEQLGIADLETEAWRCRLTLAFGDLSGAPPWAKDWLQERLERCKRLIDISRSRK